MSGLGSKVLTGIRPLQASLDYRRLWVGSTVSQLGQQMTAFTIAIQVWAHNPTRSAIVPRLIGADLLPAANALNMASFNLGFTGGPLLGAFAIGAGRYAFAYGIDVTTFTAALYAALPAPRRSAACWRRQLDRQAGTVVGARAFLKRAPNLLMTLVLEMPGRTLTRRQGSDRRCHI